MPPRFKKRELRFPTRGVERRREHRVTVDFQPPFPSPWACNVRPEDHLARRIRGGSRPGLTEWMTDLSGQTIAGLVSIPIVTEDGAVNKLAAISDETLGVFSGGDYSTPTGQLLTGAGVVIQTEAEDDILVGAGSVPAGSFSQCTLFGAGRSVYAIASTGSVTQMDLTTGAVDTLTAEDGTVPVDATLGCAYRARLVVAGEDNAIYMSRQGNLTDWDCGADVGDSGRPLVFQLAEAAEMGAHPTALIPFHDQSLLAATEWGLWLLTGDPAADGGLRNISRGIGCLGPSAWCHILDAQVGDTPVRYAAVFLGSTGLWMVASSGDGLQSLSEDRLPEELRDVDTSTTTVSLIYSPAERGIYIFLTPESGIGTHFFFDLVRKGFWPERFQSTHQPLTTAWHEGKVLLAGSDGTIRYVGGDDDDGENIESHVLIGPMRMAGPDTFGLLTRIHGMVAASSGTVTWRIITGETAEQACDRGKLAIEAYQDEDIAGAEKYTSSGATWGAGRANTRYPRVRGMWMCVWLRATTQWAYENITIESREAGNWR